MSFACILSGGCCGFGCVACLHCLDQFGLGGAPGWLVVVGWWFGVDFVVA